MRRKSLFLFICDWLIDDIFSKKDLNVPFIFLRLRRIDQNLSEYFNIYLYKALPFTWSRLVWQKCKLPGFGQCCSESTGALAVPMHLEYHLRALPSLIILKGKGKNLLVAAASRVYDPGELALLLCNLIQNGFHFCTFTFADVYSGWLKPFDLLGIIQVVNTTVHLSLEPFLLHIE